MLWRAPLYLLAPARRPRRRARCSSCCCAGARGAAARLPTRRWWRAWRPMSIARRRALARSCCASPRWSLLVVALAGPKWGFHWQEVQREGIDLIVALDTSRSMLATDVKPNRLERAKLAMLDLVPLLQGDRIGLVAVRRHGLPRMPADARLRRVRALAARRGRRHHPARRHGPRPRHRHQPRRASRRAQGKYEALILITDGEDHEGDVKEAAKRAADAGREDLHRRHRHRRRRAAAARQGRLRQGSQRPGGEVAPRRGDAEGHRAHDRRRLRAGPRPEPRPRPGLPRSHRHDGAARGREHPASAATRSASRSRWRSPCCCSLVEALDAAAPRGAAARAGGGASAPAGAGARGGGAAPLLLPALVGFLDPPGDRAAEGNRLYADGQVRRRGEQVRRGADRRARLAAARSSTSPPRSTSRASTTTRSPR